MLLFRCCHCVSIVKSCFAGLRRSLGKSLDPFRGMILRELCINFVVCRSGVRIDRLMLIVGRALDNARAFFIFGRKIYRTHLKLVGEGAEQQIRRLREALHMIVQR